MLQALFSAGFLSAALPSAIFRPSFTTSSSMPALFGQPPFISSVRYCLVCANRDRVWMRDIVALGFLSLLWVDIECAVPHPAKLSQMCSPVGRHTAVARLPAPPPRSADSTEQCPASGVKAEYSTAGCSAPVSSHLLLFPTLSCVGRLCGPGPSARLFYLLHSLIGAVPL